MAAADQKVYWEEAGRKGYLSHMFASEVVAAHANRQMWNTALEIGLTLGLTPASRVLDMGCGDGAFANGMLAHHFRLVNGVDFSEAAISRARAQAPGPQACFEVADLKQMDFSRLPAYDGAFLIGILHHVKQATPAIIRGLRTVTPRVVVLEPNGSHLVRKLLEFTPSYRAAGEDSFRTRTLMRIFEQEGFRTVYWRRINLFPNFTPGPVFRLLKSLEPVVESSRFLHGLCTVNAYGFAADA